MKMTELGFSSLCFLLALIAAGLLMNDQVGLGFLVAWGGSAAVTLAYAAVLLRRRERGERGEAVEA